MKHTTTPLTIKTSESFPNKIPHVMVQDANGSDFALIYNGHNPKAKLSKIQKAEFIVRACNNFEPLLEAAKAVLAEIDQAAELFPSNVNAAAEDRLRPILEKAIADAERE